MKRSLTFLFILSFSAAGFARDDLSFSFRKSAGQFPPIDESVSILCKADEIVCTAQLKLWSPSQPNVSGSRVVGIYEKEISRKSAEELIASAKESAKKIGQTKLMQTGSGSNTVVIKDKKPLAATWPLNASDETPEKIKIDEMWSKLKTELLANPSQTVELQCSGNNQTGVINLACTVQNTGLKKIMLRRVTPEQVRINKNKTPIMLSTGVVRVASPESSITLDPRQKANFEVFAEVTPGRGSLSSVTVSIDHTGADVVNTLPVLLFSNDVELRPAKGSGAAKAPETRF